MKNLLTIILSVLVIVGFSQPAERKINSTVKEVTVFLQGAQVTRTTAVEVKPGASTLVLSELHPPHVLENSIQAEANMGVKILGVSFRVNYLKDLKTPETTKELIKEKERLSDLIQVEKASLAIFNEEEIMLKSNKIIGGQNGLNVNDLKTAVDYYRQRLIDIQEHKQLINTKLAEYQENIGKIDSQVEKTKVTKPKPEGEIVIKIESKSDARIQLKVDYLVSEASWFPTYDIRAKDIQSPIAITYKASIGQQSGEDWENVKLTVSSANPSSSGGQASDRAMDSWI
ncbi:MAG: mucoidy inhibitor MuiA family protein [Bacteroidota bacterium]